MDKSPGVALGRLILALDRTVATLVTAPQGLDVPVRSLAMIDIDDVHFGLGRAARSADVFLLVGLPDEVSTELLAGLGIHRPVAVMSKTSSATLTDLADRLGIAVVAIDPHARWERIYNLVSRVLDTARRSPDDGESMESGATGDLFELAAEVARRTGGLISIEDERSHVLAYSTAGDEADDLRRLSILGREGPPEMLAWLRQWGVMDALRTSARVVAVDARTDLGLRERRAVAIRAPGTAEFLGVVWLQRGAGPFADDTDEVLTGAAAVAARVIARRRSAGTEHDELVRRLLGARGDIIDVDALAAQLGVDPSVAVVLVGFATTGSAEDASVPLSENATRISALTLHASAFSPLSVTSTIGDRAYVVLPGVTDDAAVEWAQVSVEVTQRQFGLRIRAVVAGPHTLAAVPELRSQIDRVLDAASLEGELIDDVTTVAGSRTGVLLGEIVALLAENPDLVDPRVSDLADLDARTGSDFTVSLRAYLDRFGDVRSAANDLHVHPNTLRYRIRRIETLTGMDLEDPATRLVVALSLRVR
ncbi:PucR family transcriptional regulator [Gordonia alkanivorans]|uniref:PucR family transcriptional regulator n=1 Tax=Gordonia alkanivorans TaxID=84096 RepID=UPI002447CC4B|nr:helix-turn-helix domain-containing protein [Gordonia alkanivorans]MDH3008541.1 helix-turn-helix domain-containing protein [Gordonia alkanivorans]MDH3017721.1 helix-turn-helix domain-containing protein [Gordonia alkanivorans]MDH3043122.1 helix-turn-helix domain-containing protein [Gordonia alkanivorans]MDH3059433.1 helix-turn-helix domain-containing protein [Gordonia alkanivorans]